MSAINWSTIIEDDRSAVVEFARGGAIRNFAKSLHSEAKSEVYRMERTYGAEHSRQLAKRALNRRGVAWVN